MFKILKIMFTVILSLLLLLAGFAAYIQISGIPTYEPPVVAEWNPECDSSRFEEGARLASMICSSCHLGRDGKWSGGFMKDLDPSFGNVWAPNITSDTIHGIGKWKPGEIAYFLRTGVRADGYYAPPWMPKFPGLSDKDLEAIICFLKSEHRLVSPSDISQPSRNPSFLAKFMTHLVMKPLDYPKQAVIAPDTSNKQEYGKYLIQSKVECFSCHSADFKKQDQLVPERSLGYLGGGNRLMDLDGNKIYSANITMDKETGIGTWSYTDFYRALKEGKRPDGKSLRYPMTPYTVLLDYEIESIWSYLKTVEPVKNKVDRTGL